MLIPTNEIIREKDINISIDTENFNFNENFKRVNNESKNIWLYVDSGNLKEEVNYDILPSQKSKVIETILSENLSNWTRKELLSMDVETVYEHFTICFGIYSGSNCELDDYLETCRKNDIRTVRDTYVEFNINGYSQGDLATIIVNKKEAEEIWGNSIENGAVTKEGLTQLFYDNTYIVKLDILGTEFISEQDGSYEYDKDKLIIELVDFFKDEVTEVSFFKEQIEDLIPREPAYLQ